MLHIEAAAIKSALGGVRIASGYLCRCPVAGHGQGKGDRNPSLSVKDGDNGLVFYCFAGCETHSIHDALARFDAGGANRPAQVAREAPAPKTTTADALALWRAAGPVAGTAGAKYLAARALPLPPPSVRFLPDAAFSPSRRFDCLVQALQAVTREIVAVQLTFLHPSKAEKGPVPRPRRMIGRSRGAALRLAAPGPVLGLAESFENAHAVMLTTSLPVWAACGAERLPLVEIPPGVQKVIVFADPDKAGLNGARKFRDANAQIEVEIRSPEGADDYAAIYEAACRKSPSPADGS